MTQKLKQCLLLYLREPNFMIASLLGFLSLCAMQTLIYWGIQKNLWNDTVVGVAVGGGKHLEIIMNRYALGDDLLTVIFVLGSWIMFVFGLLIKKQFANDRASLLPGYRLPHIAGMLITLFFILSITVLLSKGAMELSQLFFLKILGTNVTLPAIYLIIILIGLGMFYLGFLSMLYLILVGYISLIVLGQNIMPVLKFLSADVIAFNTALVVIAAAVILFVHRLLTLKNEHMEYPFQLTWPPQKTIRNQLILEHKFSKLKSLILKINNSVTIEADRTGQAYLYYKLKGIWARSGHWNTTESGRTGILSAILYGLILTFLMIMKNLFPDLINISKIESNFLLLTGAPVLITIILHYKYIIFWSYDLLKPVTRANFYKEQGIRIFTGLLGSWFIIVIFLTNIPDKLLSRILFNDVHTITFLVLTLIFSWLCLAWIAVLSALQNERAVIINGFFLCLLIMLEFFLAGDAPTGWVMANAGLCLVASVLFSKLAFEKWMEKEF